MNEKKNLFHGFEILYLIKYFDCLNLKIIYWIKNFVLLNSQIDILVLEFEGIYSSDTPIRSRSFCFIEEVFLDFLIFSWIISFHLFYMVLKKAGG